MALRGREIYFCPGCGWVHPPMGYTGVCPICKEVLFVQRCCRCGHFWRPRSRAVPRVCPECKSPYWNRARQPGKTANRMEEDTHDDA